MSGVASGISWVGVDLAGPVGVNGGSRVAGRPDPVAVARPELPLAGLVGGDVDRLRLGQDVPVGVDDPAGGVDQPAS